MQRLPDISDLLPSLLTRDLDTTTAGISLNRSKVYQETIEVYDLDAKQLGIAIIQPATGSNSATTAAISLLRQKFQDLRAANEEGIDPTPSPSLQPILFHTDSRRVTEFMPLPSDCLEWIRPLLDNNDKMILSLEELKEVFAQLIMAVDQLHNALKLVHRDIKLDNLLIRYINNRWCIYLMDYECTAEADAKNMTLDGTSRYAPPEIKSLTTTKTVGGKTTFVWIPDSPFKAETYNPLDKKAIDCYHVGIVFEYLYEALCPNPHKEINETRTQIKDLIQKLKLKDPKDRLSMSQAKNHALFGASDDACKDYFKTLKQALQATAPNFDGYNVLHAEDFFPEKNKGFYILPAVQKEIYMLASSLSNQINSITEESQDLNYIYMSIHDKAVALSRLTQESKNSVITRLHTEIESIIKMTLPISNLTKNRIRQENDFAKQTSSPENLKNAVAAAYDEYYKNNDFANLSNRPWYQFSFHGQSGFDRAKAFNDDIKKHNGSAVDIMNSIFGHLEARPGMNFEKSFKTILRKKLLSDISPLPLEEWPQLIKVKARKRPSGI